MPFCAPQIVFSSVHTSASAGFTDTFTPAGNGLYRITVAAVGITGNPDTDSISFGGVFTDAAGGEADYSIVAQPSLATTVSREFFLNPSTPVALTAAPTGTLTFNTWFIVEQLA